MYCLLATKAVGEKKRIYSGCVITAPEHSKKGKSTRETAFLFSCSMCVVSVEKRCCCCPCIVLLCELGDLYVNKKVKPPLREQHTQRVRRKAEQKCRIFKKRPVESKLLKYLPSFPYSTSLVLFCQPPKKSSALKLYTAYHVSS